MTRKRERVNPFAGADPDTLTALSQGAVTNRAAMTAKQKRDGARVRVRLDVPQTIKETLATAAADEQTSTSQLGAFLLAWSLTLYLDGNKELKTLLQASTYFSRSPRVPISIDLEGVLKLLKESAEYPARHKSRQRHGANGGANGGANIDRQRG